jgi:hypothetical protein
MQLFLWILVQFLRILVPFRWIPADSGHSCRNVWGSEKYCSNLAKPLNDLLKKDQKFERTDECQQAFDELKKRFTKEPVLAMPDQTWPIQIETDASKYVTGAVLTQLDINGDRHPISFISKTLSPAE